MEAIAEQKKFETNYYQTWLQYKQSQQYKDAIKIMQQKGMKQPYIDNILSTAFTAGWGEKPIFSIVKSK